MYVTTRALQLLVLAASLSLVACGPAVDRPGTLTRLRSAIQAEVSDHAVLEQHNQLARETAESGALEGMFQYELEEALGRGTECGVNHLCAQRDFRGNDWIYELGHAPGDDQLAAGPTLIVGFDSTGRVFRTFYMTRSAPQSAR
jgi:hypothetical protein